MEKKKSLFWLLGLLLAYPVSFMYVKYMGNLSEYLNILTPIWMALFPMAFIAWNEITLRSRREKGNKKSYFWYVVMILASALYAVSPSRDFTVLAVHTCAIYSVIVANSSYYVDEGDKFIAFDVFNGGVLIPIMNLGSIFKDCSTYAASRKKKDGEAEAPQEKNGWSAVIGFSMFLVALPLFFVSAALLTEVNPAFGDFLDKIFDYINFDFSTVGELLLAIPVTFYLYGLVRGGAANDNKKTYELGKKFNSYSEKMKTGAILATRVIGTMFVGLYLLFFLVGGTYFFGGFMGIVPGKLTAAEYARSGFFQLLAIMIINMVIYLMLNSFGKKSEGKSGYGKFMIISLMAESIVFAVISMSKLALYLHNFGYTDARVFAIWWVVIIAVAAALVILSTVRGGNFVKYWIHTVAVSFLILCVICGINFAVNGRYKSIGVYGVADEPIIAVEYTCYVDGEENNSGRFETDGHLGYKQYSIDVPETGKDLRVDIKIYTEEGYYEFEDANIPYDNFYFNRADLSHRELHKI